MHRRLKKYNEKSKSLNKYFTKKRFLSIILFSLLLSSCSKYNEMIYFKNEGVTPEIKLPADYVLRPADILYIRITSSDNNVNNLILPNVREERITASGDASLYINSIIISNDSTVIVPIVGKIKAAGYSLIQFEQELQKAIDELVIETSVYVRLLSFRITVLGEVARPGVITIYQPNATVLDAIARSGDLTLNAKRTEISVIRNTQGIMQQYEMNLSDINIVNSPGFYIYPDDVIYVKPKRSKAFRENLTIYSFMLSTITTFILILNFIAK